MLDKLNNKYIIAFDWLLALSAIAYGFYCISIESYSHMSALIILSGILGCFMAYFRPVNMLKYAIKKSLIKRKL